MIAGNRACLYLDSIVELNCKTHLGSSLGSNWGWLGFWSFRCCWSCGGCRRSRPFFRRSHHKPRRVIVLCKEHHVVLSRWVPIGWGVGCEYQPRSSWSHAPASHPCVCWYLSLSLSRCLCLDQMLRKNSLVKQQRTKIERLWMKWACVMLWREKVRERENHLIFFCQNLCFHWGCAT